EVVCGFADRFEELAAACDGVVLIAPETSGVLTKLARRVERCRGRLLSPSGEFCAWASDKSQVAETMQGARVPMPRGILLQPGNTIPGDFPFPAVVKPNDGCGSQGVRLLRDSTGFRSAAEGVPYRLEEFVAGTAASVAILCGPNGAFPLPACSQR